ncbi:hypothetical protein HanRHA438_Chr16g0758621 [Helianthus annuus]|uniref:Uncharacterized protein n=1 Tax=Helianthus annuus TaxID=4232 RepID=A0A251SCD8_HELAN|nr:hypothetical protein HanXRQr2_Chr16g0746971 [Helianthus annuus]KAJ0438020.1 hypothetical protein HanHA300_Chr16g0609151 [Helianthus annuus]KAJ0442629.1 hypothetical protein HanIR_Chr16g0811601 [Helianthus annuus]KAJ0460346.1 hypothetical protein HanHA89_Chr16g0659761 [Helianthus annuus]KAJ0640789.1 hypothetical protein HanLR1_Chr16g0619751 [Helianthus annuus]
MVSAVVSVSDSCWFQGSGSACSGTRFSRFGVRFNPVNTGSNLVKLGQGQV